MKGAPNDDPPSCDVPQNCFLLAEREVYNASMSGDLPSRIQFFDRSQDYAVVERRLPHWSQAGTIAFITWRTWDSMPVDVVKRWHVEREQWLRSHLAPRDESTSNRDSVRQGISSRGARGLLSRLRATEPEVYGQFQEFCSNRWHDHLDACHGACVLKRPELSQIVANCLLHFDGDRYDLADFVVMPNHVHVLAAFPDEEAMLQQCDSWKHFTATKINRELGASGRFWQQDDFDHLVRSLEQFEYLRRYIAENPHRANLRPGEFRHYSK
jgi:type I restriction enzyme R subunit